MSAMAAAERQGSNNLRSILTGIVEGSQVESILIHHFSYYKAKGTPTQRTENKASLDHLASTKSCLRARHSPENSNMATKLLLFLLLLRRTLLGR